MRILCQFFVTKITDIGPDFSDLFENVKGMLSGMLNHTIPYDRGLVFWDTLGHFTFGLVFHSAESLCILTGLEELIYVNHHLHLQVLKYLLLLLY